MRQSILIFLLMAVSILLISCGPKRVQEKVIQNIAQQRDAQKKADLFAELSLDDIRNNVELFDTQLVVRGDTRSASDRPAILSDEHEARLIDVAIPFGAHLLDNRVDGEHSHETVLSYLAAMSTADIAAFYIEQMERLGWHCARCIAGSEQLLIFEKPDRSCNVVIRSVAHPKRVDTQFTKIVLFLAQHKTVC